MKLVKILHTGIKSYWCQGLLRSFQSSIGAIEILEDINLDNEAKEAEKFARKEAFGDDDKCYPPRR